MAVNLEETLALTQNYVSAASLPHVLDFIDPSLSSREAIEDKVSGIDRNLRDKLYGEFTKRLAETCPDTLEKAMAERERARRRRGGDWPPKRPRRRDHLFAGAPEEALPEKRPRPEGHGGADGDAARERHCNGDEDGDDGGRRVDFRFNFCV